MNMKKKLSDFALNLAKIRKERGLSQKDLENVSGISARMIGYYEKHATYSPPMNKIKALANALNIDISNLLGIKESENINDLKEFDVRTIKKIKNLLILNRQDRASVYQMIDLLLQKDEYKNKAKELQEIESK